MDTLKKSENETIQEVQEIEEVQEIQEVQGIEETQETQEGIDERILLKRILIDNLGAPVLAIIRDTLDDEDPERWNSIIKKWVAKDYFVVIPPGNDIRDGYLTETGKLYAKVTYNL